MLNLLVLSYTTIKNAFVFFKDKYIPQVGAKIKHLSYILTLSLLRLLPILTLSLLRLLPFFSLLPLSAPHVMNPCFGCPINRPPPPPP